MIIPGGVVGCTIEQVYTVAGDVSQQSMCNQQEMGMLSETNAKNKKRTHARMIRKKVKSISNRVESHCLPNNVML